MCAADTFLKISFLRIKPALCVVFLTALMFPISAVAQVGGTTASSVTPERFTPPLQKLDGAVVFERDTGTQAPPGSERIGITLTGVDLQGGLAQMADANAALQTRLTGKRIPVSELFEAVGALEEAYANAGFVLARIVLPQQNLRDGGVLKVVVINGFVEEVDSSSAPPEVQKRIDTLTAPLINRKGLTLEEIERQLLLAGDTAGVALDSALGAGRLPGGTVLTLEPEYKKVTGFVGFDNNAPEDLGGFTASNSGGFVLNTGVEFNSYLGYGETLYLRASGAPQQFLNDDPRYRVLAAGFVMPLGVSGLALNGEVTNSDTTPDDDDVPTRSSFDRQSLRLIYPVIRSRQVNLTTQFSVDRQQDSQDLIAGGGTTPIYKDKTTVLRLGGSLSYQHEDGAFSDVGAILSQGIDALGARSADDVGSGTPLSRAGSDVKFTKLGISGFHQRALAENVILSLTGRAQISFGDPLVTSEQFGLTGSRELSGFESGELRGDSGWVARAEFAYQNQTTIASKPVILSPYAFLAAGGISIEEPTAVERSNETASSFGVGLDLFTKQKSRFRASSLRVELARGERKHGRDDTRVNISGNLRF